MKTKGLNVWAARLVRGGLTIAMGAPLPAVLVVLAVAMSIAGCYEASPGNKDSEPPAAPGGLTVSRSSESTLDISWDRVAEASVYELYRDTAGVGAFTNLIYDGTETSFQDTGLQSGTTYYYRVAATNSEGSSPLSGVVSGATPELVLIVIWWNREASREEFGALDTTTGALTFLGQVGDLTSWNNQSLIVGDILYVSGIDDAGRHKLYTLDLLSGSTINTANFSRESPALSGLHGEDFIVIWRNLEAFIEEFGLLDVESGAITPVGQVGDMTAWIGHSIIVGDILYVFGTDDTTPWKLYSIDLVSGSLIDDVPLSKSAALAGLYGDDFIVIWWSPDASREEFGVLDRRTGAITTVGQVGDLTSWISRATIYNDTLYVIGFDGADRQKLYELDLVNGSLIAAVGFDQPSLSLAGMYIR